MTVYTLAIEGVGQGPTCDEAAAIECLTMDLENAGPGDKITVTVSEMTEEEYRALPDWGGY